MVDVTMLLAGGVGLYDDARQMIRDLIEVLEPGESPLEKGYRLFADLVLPHDWRPGGIRRVGFVAPKLDLVHPSDRDRMVYLLRRMVEKYAQNRDGLEYKVLNCSAVVSSKVLPDAGGQRILVGVPLRDASGKKIPPGVEQRFTVSELPDDWPLQWGPGQYSFPEVYPRIPMRKDAPPEQMNLDKVLTFLLG
jgi:predicted YcjX-like family ATPase